MTLLQMSMSAAILIIIITVLRAVCIHKLPKKTFMCLWGLVLFRLLIPISIPSIFSIYSWIPQSKPAVSESANHLPRLSLTSDMARDNITKNLSTQNLFNFSFSLWTVVWMTGFLLCAIYFVMAYHRGIKKFKNSLPLETVFIKEWKEKHPLKRTLSIRISNQVFTPLSYGIFKPVILLPQNLDFENTKVLNYILTHEYVHIRHFDILTKLLMILALSIHWFNPMVWIMFLLLNRDIELVCDETVVNLFGEKSKSSYAHILIDMEIQKAGLMPLCNNFSRNPIEERIGAIMKMKKMTIFSLVLAGVLVAGLTMSFATSAQTKTSLNIEKVVDPSSCEEQKNESKMESKKEYKAKYKVIFYEDKTIFDFKMKNNCVFVKGREFWEAGEKIQMKVIKNKGDLFEVGILPAEKISEFSDYNSYGLPIAKSAKKDSNVDVLEFMVPNSAEYGIYVREIGYEKNAEIFENTKDEIKNISVEVNRKFQNKIEE